MQILISAGHMNMNMNMNMMPTTTRNHSDGLNLRFPFGITRRCASNPFIVSSKKSSFPDFQEYAKPTRLLPARDLRGYRDEYPDKIISSLQSNGSQTLYKVLLRTSSIYESDLSDLNAGILICIIDEHGNSILERLPASFCEDDMQQYGDSVASDYVRFQRGSVDKFILWGPELGSIQAMWISVESGKWRLGGGSLTTIRTDDYQTEEASSTENVYHSVTYKFEAEEVLLGEGSEMTMIELRPCQVTQYSGVDLRSTFDDGDMQAVSLSERRMSNEESMREYSDLKYSLLLYDSILIFAGTSISWVAGGESTGVAFFIGGVAGFLYLLLLQRSVDKLPAPESVTRSDRSNSDGVSGGTTGPLLILALGFGTAVLALNHCTQNLEAAVFTPRGIIIGMTGFLACKLSVVLAAVKPLSIGMQDK